MGVYDVYSVEQSPGIELSVEQFRIKNVVGDKTLSLAEALCQLLNDVNRIRRWQIAHDFSSEAASVGQLKCDIAIARAIEKKEEDG